jgi:transposase InsO family protein
VHGLIQAILKRGLPRALMTDNGAAMLAEETRQGLSRLAIVHETTLPYSPYQNGKQEVFWATMEGRLIAMLRGLDQLTLSFLNRAAQAWVEQDYHRSLHREIGAAPLQRMLDGPTAAQLRPPAHGDPALSRLGQAHDGARGSSNRRPHRTPAAAGQDAQRLRAAPRYRG